MSSTAHNPPSYDWMRRRYEEMEGRVLELEATIARIEALVPEWDSGDTCEDCGQPLSPADDLLAALAPAQEEASHD